MDRQAGALRERALRPRRRAASSPSPTLAATSAGWSRSTSRAASAAQFRAATSSGTSRLTTSAETARLLAYAVNEDGYSRVWLHDRVTRSRAGRSAGASRGVLTGLKFSPDGDRLAISMSTATSAGDVWSWDVTGAASSPAGPIRNSGRLDPATLAEPQLIRFKSFDGLSVPAFVYRPAGRPGRRAERR